MIFKKVRWIKAFYYFYMCVIWSTIICIFIFLGWKGYIFMTSDLFMVDSSYNVSFRILEKPVFTYMEFDEYLMEWKSSFFENYGAFFVYDTSELQSKLREITFIEDFHLEKRYPNKLTVKYTVREPVMSLYLRKNGENARYLLDREGRVVIAAEDSIIRHFPAFISSEHYNYSQAGWRGHKGIQYCLALLESLKNNPRLDNVYWQLEGVHYEAPGVFLLKMRNGTVFSIYARSKNEVLGVLQRNAHTLSDLDGKKIIIRGESE